MIERRAAHRLLRALRVGALAGCCALLLAIPLAIGAQAAISYTHETIAQFEKQLKAGEVKQVTINPRLRSLRTSLKNGQYVVAKYGKKQEEKYKGALEARGVPVKTLSPAQALAEQKSQPVHHKLRYIAAAVLVVIIVIVGVVLYVNRRRKALRD
jgi:ATP-dependent Zn protease